MNNKNKGEQELIYIMENSSKDKGVEKPAAGPFKFVSNQPTIDISFWKELGSVVFFLSKTLSFFDVDENLLCKFLNGRKRR